MDLFDKILGDLANAPILNFEEIQDQVEKANRFDEIRAMAVDVEWEEVK